MSVTTTPLKQTRPLLPQVERTVTDKQNMTLMLVFPWKILQLYSAPSSEDAASIMFHACQNIIILVYYCTLRLLPKLDPVIISCYKLLFTL